MAVAVVVAAGHTAVVAVEVRVRSIDQALVVALVLSIVAAVGAACVRYATDLLHQANQAVVEEAGAYRIRLAAEEEGSHSFRAASAAYYHAL